MKKVLLSLFAILMVTLPTLATNYDATSKVTPIGENLLTKNGIAISGVKFMVVSGNADNSSYSTNKVINISTNDLAYAGNDNEVASIIANELGHIISGHTSKGKFAELVQTTTNINIPTNETAQALATNLKTLKEEKEADLVATELMITAGYNPLAIIVVNTKQNPSAFETLQGKPANADRIMNTYDYLLLAYPDKVKVGYGCNEYRNFLTYADATISARSSKEVAKIKKELTKAKKNTASTIAKFKVRGGISGWDAAYSLLNSTK